jgi:hypothetical protein
MPRTGYGEWANITSWLIGLVSVGMVVADVSAQAVPKQANFEVTFYGVGTASKTIPVQGEDVVTFYEDTLLFINNPSAPLFQDMVAKCMSVGYSKGSVNGYCVLTDKDGDKFVETISKAAGAKAGKGTFGSGTGKYKGIDGAVDWEPISFLPAEKGSYNFIGKKTGRYQLP